MCIHGALCARATTSLNRASADRTLDGGFHTLNATVLEQMRGWLIDSMVNALQMTGLRFEALPVEYRNCCW